MAQARIHSDSSIGTQWKIGLFVVLIVGVRFVMLTLQYDNLQQDPDAYWRLANGLASESTYGLHRQDGPTFPTAYRPPLYPILLSPLVAFGQFSKLAIAGLHLILGVGSSVIVWRIGKLWGLGQVSLLAGLIVAFDPLLLNQSTLIMTETPAVFFVVLALYCLSKSVLLGTDSTSRSVEAEAFEMANLAAVSRFRSELNWSWLGIAGACLGLAVLCRPPFLVWAGLIILQLLFVPRHFSIALSADSATREGDRTQRKAPFLSLVKTRAKLVLGLVIPFSLVVSPWVIRNQLLFHSDSTTKLLSSRPILATTHGGYTLLLANNASFYDHLAQKGDSIIWEAENPEFVGLIVSCKVAALERVMKPAKWGDERSDRVDQDARADSLVLGRASPAFSGQSTVDLQIDSLTRSQRLRYELLLDEEYYQLAKTTIRNRPASFCHATLIRVVRLWTPIYHSQTSASSGKEAWLRFGVAGWYLMIYLGVVTSGWRIRSKLGTAPLVWGLMLMFTLTLIHAFFWSDFRMRAPMIPVLALFAAPGLFRINQLMKSLVNRTKSA